MFKKQVNHENICMSMIFVSDLLDHPALIEIEATAVIPYVNPYVNFTITS